jgi:hypothetical protein
MHFDDDLGARAISISAGTCTLWRPMSAKTSSPPATSSMSWRKPTPALAYMPRIPPGSRPMMSAVRGRGRSATSRRMASMSRSIVSASIAASAARPTRAPSARIVCVMSGSPLCS